MTNELDLELSAFVDGEPTDPHVLLRALEQPDALASLRAMVELRAALQTDAEPGAHAIEGARAAIGRTRSAPSRSVRALGWAAAAALVLALGVALGMVLAPAHTQPQQAAGPRPPTPDLVAEFALEPPRT